MITLITVALAMHADLAVALNHCTKPSEEGLGGGI